MMYPNDYKEFFESRQGAPSLPRPPGLPRPPSSDSPSSTDSHRNGKLRASSSSSTDSVKRERSSSVFGSAPSFGAARPSRSISDTDDVLGRSSGTNGSKSGADAGRKHSQSFQDSPSARRGSFGSAADPHEKASVSSEGSNEMQLSRTVLTDEDMYSEPDKAQDPAYWTFTPKRSQAGRSSPSGSQEGGTHAFLAEHCLTRHPHLLDPSDQVVHQVQFKCSYRYFTTGAHGPKYYNPNEFVVVKGERGEDLGIVVALFSHRLYLDKLQEEGYSVEDDEFKLRRILRLATKYERSELAAKFYDENTVAQYCADVVSQVYSLPMNILTAEYQFDRNKLVVYYSAKVHVDFRELVKNIFATFKTSVWLKKVERGQAFVGRSHAAVGLKTGLIYGL